MIHAERIQTQDLVLALLDPESGLPCLVAESGPIPWGGAGSARDLGRLPRVRQDPAGLRVQGARPVGRSRARAGVGGALPPGAVVQVAGQVGVVLQRGRAPLGGPVVELSGMIAASPCGVRAMIWAALAGAAGMDLLVLGPTGSGKERIARIAHRARALVHGPAPFLPLNMAAVPPELCAAELFGHERGAFTGASRARLGAFREAGSGVIFLDEIGECAPAAQAALLRVLEERRVRPVGGSASSPVRAAVVAATNREPHGGGRIDGLRDDLVQRLAGAVVRLRPLNERPEDIPPLAVRALRELSEEGLRAGALGPVAMGRLLHHDWPGNVRELRRVLRQAALLSAGEEISPGAIGEAMAPLDARPESPPRASIDPVEREIIRLARLSPRARGVGRRRLGISKSSFYRRLKALDPAARSEERAEGSDRASEPGNDRKSFVRVG